MDKKEVLKLVKAQIKKINKEYETHPTRENQGDCLDAKDGFEVLLSELKKTLK